MRQHRGLSLLEMLVVLVVVSLLATLVVQGLGFFLAKYDSVNRLQAKMLNDGVPEGWFASSVAGMVPLSRPARSLSGDETGFEGITMTALTAESGLPQRIGWTVDRREQISELRYREGTAVDWLVWSTPGEPRFEYADARGEWFDSWPPDERAPKRIPSLIRLVDADATVWLARPGLHPVPVPNFLLRE